LIEYLNKNHSKSSPDQLEEHKTTLIQELESRSKEKLDRLDQQLSQLETDLKGLKMSVDLCQTSIVHATDDQFKQFFPLLRNQLTRTQDDPRFSSPLVETKHLEITQDRPSRRSSLVNTLKLVEVDSEEASIIKPVLKENKYDEFFRPSFIFGSSGSKAGELKSPTSVAVDSKNRFIVCDSGNNRIQIFDQDGNHISVFGKKGKKKGRFSRPENVLTDSKDRIIVSESSSRRIQIFDPEGNHLKTVSVRRSKESTETGGDTGEVNFAVGAEDDIIACDQDNNQVRLHDSDGVHYETIGKGLKPTKLCLPGKILIGMDGRIVVNDQDNNRVCIFDSFGNLIHQIPRPSLSEDRSEASEIAVDPYNGNVFVREEMNQKIKMCNMDGIHLKDIELSTKNIFSMIVDLYGNLLVLVKRGEKTVIEVFDEYGKKSASFGERLSLDPTCPLVVDQFNRIIVCDRENDRILVFS
jgi:DNA-binding beta-propeller fold protein YncE